MENGAIQKCEGHPSEMNWAANMKLTRQSGRIHLDCENQGDKGAYTPPKGCVNIQAKAAIILFRLTQP